MQKKCRQDMTSQPNKNATTESPFAFVMKKLDSLERYRRRQAIKNINDKKTFDQKGRNYFDSKVSIAEKTVEKIEAPQLLFSM